MRILIFGPNGSGKGTQSSFLVNQYQLAHVESGGIFRQNIKGGTDLGKEALKYIDKGELVPDSITIPMVLDRLAEDDCKGGFIVDGFPRTPAQAKALVDGLDAVNTPLNAVIIIDVTRETARARLLGRRTCPNGHPNNCAIGKIAPKPEGGQFYCWSCNAETTVRKDDIDETAIDQRLDIYFTETVASIDEVKTWATSKIGVTVVTINGEGEIHDIRDNIFQAIAS